MKKIGFIGAYDKTDFMMYIAKILTVLGNRVIVIDSTITQKAKYVIPYISPTRSYITEYEEIDFAVGFNSFDAINNYLGVVEGNTLQYDIALIDIDSSKAFENFEMNSAQQNYFVTSFDLYSLKKGLEILSGLVQPISMTKVLFSKLMLKEEDEYLDFLSSPYKVNWKQDNIYFPFEQGDQSAIIENQRVAKIKLKNLTSHYKESLLVMCEEILENVSSNELRKVLKALEKGV